MTPAEKAAKERDGAKPARRQRVECTVEGCSKIDDGPHGLCKMHTSRLKRTGRLDKLPRLGKKLEDHPHWCPTDLLTYNTVHLRLKRIRGAAREYCCCACGGPANQWAYDHLDPYERRDKGGPFSPSLDHYQPMCAPCHKEMDLALLHHRSAV